MSTSIEFAKSDKNRQFQKNHMILVLVQFHPFPMPNNSSPKKSELDNLPRFTALYKPMS